MFKLKDGRLILKKDFKSLTKQEAIKLSLKKWKKIVRLEKFGREVSHDGGASTCALCSKYKDSIPACKECPIEKSGNGCTYAFSIYDTWSDWCDLNNRKPAIREAQNMVDLLEKLLKENEL